MNALVQDSVFSANELAEIAKQLDEEERARMAEAGVNTTEYQRFLKVCFYVSYCAKYKITDIRIHWLFVGWSAKHIISSC